MADFVKKIVIFGASGAIGSNLALDLCAAGYEVVAVGRRASDNGFFAEHGIAYCSVDIANKDSFQKLPQADIFSVLHFAGPIPDGMADYDPASYVSTIVQGTYNVLEYARKVGAERFIYPHTFFDIRYLFGTFFPIPDDVERRTPLEGDHAMYVMCKNAAVNFVEHYHAAYKMRCFVFRMPRIYMYLPDPYEWMDHQRRMVSDRYMIYRVMSGQGLEVWGDPTRILETMCIRDFEQLVRCALTADCEGGLYNVGSGGTTLEDRVRGIAEVFAPEGTTCPITYRPEKPNGQQFVLDYSKAEKELGYHPEYTWKKYLLDFKREMQLQRFHLLRGYESDYFDLSKLSAVADIGRAGWSKSSMGNHK